MAAGCQATINSSPQKLINVPPEEQKLKGIHEKNVGQHLSKVTQDHIVL